MRPLTLSTLLEAIEDEGPDQIAGQRADALAKMRKGYKAGDPKAKKSVSHLKAMRAARNSFKYGGNPKDNIPGRQATVPKNIPDSARKATRELRRKSM